MYKYLTRKLENTKGITIDDFTLIAFEMAKNSKSELIEEFEELEPKEICEVLEWKDTAEVHEMITDEIEIEGSVAGLMYRANKVGFLARIHIPKPNKVGKVYMYSSGISFTEFVYADTIGELTEKAVKIGTERQANFIAWEKEKDLKDDTSNKAISKA